MRIEYLHQFKFYETFKSMGPKFIQMKDIFPSSATLFNTFYLQPYSANHTFPQDSIGVLLSGSWLHIPSSSVYLSYHLQDHCFKTQTQPAIFSFKSLNGTSPSSTLHTHFSFWYIQAPRWCGIHLLF